MTRVGIIGAGVTGLVVGRLLARAGHEVALFERWPDVGGMASAFDLGNGTWIERYYHHLFESDSAMIALHEELTPGELEWHASSVGMLADGRVWPFTGPLDLLRYSPLPPADRVRLGLAVLRLQRRTDWERMDGIPAIEWLKKECGERSVHAVWRPLLLGKFGEEAANVPLAWLWSKLVLRRRKDARGMGRERLGYPRSSFRHLCVALANDIRANGGAVHLDREVLRVVRSDGGGYVLGCAGEGAYRTPPLSGALAPGRDATCDLVVITTPTFITRKLFDGWPADIEHALDDTSYRAAVVLLLELDRSLSPIYWLNVADQRVRALGIIEHTNLVPAARYPARYVYVSNYVAQDDPLVTMTTDELIAAHLPGLRIVAPAFGQGNIERAWSFREPAAQPVPRLNGRERLLPIATDVPGLFLANTTQIHPEDRGTNYSVVLGQRAAAQILARHPGVAGRARQS